MQKYPDYNVRLKAQPVNLYVKFLPFKNGDPATSPEILKPDVTVAVVGYPHFESEISILLQQYLDPKGASRYDTITIIILTTEKRRYYCYNYRFNISLTVHA